MVVVSDIYKHCASIVMGFRPLRAVYYDFAFKNISTTVIDQSREPKVMRSTYANKIFIYHNKIKNKWITVNRSYLLIY